MCNIKITKTHEKCFPISRVKIRFLDYNIIDFKVFLRKKRFFFERKRICVSLSNLTTTKTSCCVEMPYLSISQRSIYVSAKKKLSTYLMNQFVPLNIFPLNTNKRIGCRAVVLSEKREIGAFHGILQMKSF